MAAALVAAAVVALPAAAAARTKIVYAGGPVAFQKALDKKYHGDFAGYLIQRVTINAGDTVVWSGGALSQGFHTVDIPAKGGTDLPLFLPVPGQTASGLDAAGNPFWFAAAKLPQIGFDPAIAAPSGGHVYDGAARVASGLPLSPKPVNFTVTFTKPGVYEYFCDVHAGMHGWVVVRPKGKPVPSAAADARSLAAAEKALLAQARRLARPKLKAHLVELGNSAPNGLEDLQMFPAKLSVARGTVVTFTMSTHSFQAHTATFGPPSYLKQLANAFIGQTGLLDSRGVYPSDPAMPIVLTPTAHGNGFANVGTLDRDPTTPLKPSGTIKFTTPGVYHFICLIHPFMRGTITVK